MENTTGDILKKWKSVDIEPPKKVRKKAEDLMVSFAKTGEHYLYGTGQVKNYKFEDILEYQEYFRHDKTSFIEWKSLTSGIKYYSAMELLNNTCCGLVGEIQQANVLTVKGKFTFVRRGNAVVLTYSKN